LEYIDHSLYYNNTLFEEKYNAIMGVLNEKRCKTNNSGVYIDLDTLFAAASSNFPNPQATTASYLTGYKRPDGWFRCYCSWF
jgi:hypothetical protein